MNFKNKLRMGFLITLILVTIYLIFYYFYDGTDYNQSGQGILVQHTYDGV